MHLDHQPVCAGGGGCQRQRLHQVGMPGGMGRIHHHGQMRFHLDERNRRNIQRVAGVCLKRADAPLAEDDALVAPGHDIFGAHEQLLQGVGQAAL